MKKILSYTIVIICLFYSIFVVCSVLAGPLNYNFRLNNSIIVLIVLTVLLLAAAVGLFITKIQMSRKFSIFSSLLLPIITLSYIILIINNKQNRNILFILAFISIVISVYIFRKFSLVFAVKIFSGFISILLITYLCIATVLLLLFGDFIKQTVIKTIESPGNKYRAEVIYSDQGALGGDSYVLVAKIDETVDIFIGKFTRPSIKVYQDKKIAKNYDILWQDQDTLYVNGSIIDMIDNEKFEITPI